jgi:hypothetical protein
MENIDYIDFINNCQTGDLLLYSSKKWYSYIIEYLGASHYSHVSMIIRDPIWINPKLKGLYIFESGIENTYDVLNDNHILGVQLVKLEEALKYYKNNNNGNIYYIKNNFERTSNFYDKLKDIIIDNDRKPYDLNVIDWIGARFNLHIIHRQTFRYFCSALIAYVFTQLELLPSNTDWTIISPTKYSFYENSRLTFINCQLDPEKIINKN